MHKTLHDVNGRRNLVAACFAAVCFLVQLSMGEELNDLRVASDAELEQLARSLKAHELFALSWPSQEDIKKHRCSVSPAQKDDAVESLRSIVRNDVVPDGLEDILIPMARWGHLTERPSQTGEGADVFITRFKTGDVTIQVIDGTDSVFVGIRGEKDSVDGDEAARKAFVLRAARMVLADRLLVQGESDLWVWSNRSSRVALMGSWTPTTSIVGRGQGGSVLVRTDTEAVSSRIQYWTNGKFVLLQVRKNLGVRVRDPYGRRFSRNALPSTDMHDDSAGEVGGASTTPIRGGSGEHLLPEIADQANAKGVREFLDTVHVRKGVFEQPERRQAAINTFAEEYLSRRKGASPETARTIGREGVEIAVGLAHLAGEEPDMETRRIMLGKMKEIGAVASAGEADRTVTQTDRQKVDRLIKQMNGETGIEGAVPDPQSELSDMSVAALLYAVERVEQGTLSLQTRQAITKALANSENPALFKFFTDTVQRAEDEKLTRFAVRGLERILEKCQGNEQTPTR